MFIRTASGAPSRPLRRGVYLRISPPRLAIFSALLIGSWVAIWLCTRAHASVSLKRMSVTAATQPGVHASSQPVTPHAAPWGELEVTPIQLAPPIDAAERFALVDTGTWYFRDCTPAQLAQILQTTGMPDDQRQSLLKSCSPEVSINGLVARPDPALVLALSNDARTALYRILAADPHNPQAEPFRHRLGTDWFAGSGLPEDVVSVARRLVYRRGEMEAFVDVSAIGPYLKNEAERAALYRTLCAQSALLVRLHVRPESDIDALVAYWGNGGRERQVRPFLESLSKVPGGSAISVAQLMPQFARARAYTFPRLEGSSPNGPQDCHWTSFNFWNPIPSDAFSQADNVGREIRTAYHPIDKPQRLGDIVFLLNEKGDGIHSAVFVADDIVFTKNGSNMAAPWIFMRLADLQTYYETNGAVKTIFLRKNSF